MLEFTKEEQEERKKEEARRCLGYLQRSIKEKAQIKKSLDFVDMCSQCTFYCIGHGKISGCEACVFGKYMRSVL